MGIKIKHGLLLFIIFIIGMTILAACASALTMPTSSEFTLTPHQTALLTNTDLTVRLIGLSDDQRCPSEIECAASGPVSLSISAQIGDAEPTNINLQVFTSNNGRAPDLQFEGIVDRAVFEGYLIRVVSVLPYPARAFDEIKVSEYRVIFIVNKAE